MTVCGDKIKMEMTIKTPSLWDQKITHFSFTLTKGKAWETKLNKYESRNKLVAKIRFD